MTDILTFGETALRLSPADDERLETTDKLRLHVSGTESNVAVAASRAGADATWLSKLPETPLGRRVVADLHRQGVETDVTWTAEGRQTLLFDEPGVEPRSARRIEDRTAGAVASVEPGDLPMDRVQTADAVLVAGSTFALGGDVAETAAAVTRAGRGTGTVAMVLDYRSDMWSPAAARETLETAFDAVDVLIAAEDEIRTVFDRTGTPRELAHTVASTRDFETVVVTRSESGALAWENNVIHERERIDGETVDPGGQQAAFAGAFLERRLSGASTDEALSHGVASAALVRSVPGPTLTASREEIEATVSADRDK